MNKKDYRKNISISGKNYEYFSISELSEEGYSISSLPFSIRILVENILRNMGDGIVEESDLKNICKWKGKYEEPVEIPYYPARVLMQDFTGVPAVVDLAAMRDAMSEIGGDPEKVNPLVPVDLIVDHSVQVDYYGSLNSLNQNVKKEYERNIERYTMLKWAQNSFDNFSVVPPNSGICHQVNLEYLGKVVRNDSSVLFPDTLVGTDSHTPMINGIGVMAWGVGGIEAEAVMLGQPYYMPIPEVIGVNLKGEPGEGVTSTDIVLSITQILRKFNVVGKFVEYFGDGLKNLSVFDRATISNMTPEYGATLGFFPIDHLTLDYLKLTNRNKEAEIVEKYAKENGFYNDYSQNIKYTEVLDFDLGSVEPSLAGPARPQDRISLSDMKNTFYEILGCNYEKQVDERNITAFNEESKEYAEIDDSCEPAEIKEETIKINGENVTIRDGSVVIAALTSCTNTSNPYVMLGAGLIARKAVEAGLKVPAYVKTSLAPGSKVVIDYLKTSGLLPYLEGLGFHVTAYGCTTCIGNSGPLKPEIEKAIDNSKLNVASVLSGNRNFEARIHQKVRSNFLASPMLVLAFALAGRVDIDMYKEPLGRNVNGEDIYLKDLWPSGKEVQDYVSKYIDSESFSKEYSVIFEGDENWKKLDVARSTIYKWDENSTYIKKPPYFDNFTPEPPKLQDIKKARVLLLLGDTVTTDHISPAGSIPSEYPAGKYLLDNGVQKSDFNSYGSRRGNHEVMIRGTFANVRIKNKLVDPKEGGFTIKFPEEKEMYVYDASLAYLKENTPLVVLAGKEYGTGSSRDWAAKGTQLLGVKAVIAESYERIHKSNLVGMGVLPLQFEDGNSWQSLGLKGTETFSIEGLENIAPRKQFKVTAVKNDGEEIEFNVISRLDTEVEVRYFTHGGILPYVLRMMIK
ncbi:MAG: aconitate hydratase AcnA [Flexistipes sinusarabici]|uniref:Aconitate hydratase n=1 Tax=Flexistipes sinusarabici TaxID=2352 RepID=A0A5D0MLJ7_FLESI|nr:aconitate hydratase AcnA [Flexistipes sinusarabici]TYB33886.1 MAG: aconitate hydratase AcnA [Flexistipes sinusarabici]